MSDDKICARVPKGRVIRPKSIYFHYSWHPKQTTSTFADDTVILSRSRRPTDKSCQDGPADKQSNVLGSTSSSYRGLVNIGTVILIGYIFYILKVALNYSNSLKFVQSQQHFYIDYGTIYLVYLIYKTYLWLFDRLLEFMHHRNCLLRFFEMQGPVVFAGVSANV